MHYDIALLPKKVTNVHLLSWSVQNYILRFNSKICMKEVLLKPLEFRSPWTFTARSILLVHLHTSCKVSSGVCFAAAVIPH